MSSNYVRIGKGEPIDKVNNKHLPSCSSQWHDHSKAVFDLLNVTLTQVHHDYIYDPYASYGVLEEGTGTSSPGVGVTVSTLIQSAITPGQPLYTEALARSYQIIKKRLEYVAQTPDYDETTMEFPYWRRVVQQFVREADATAATDFDPVIKFLMQLVYQGAVYEDLFMSFCDFVTFSKPMQMTIMRCPEFYWHTFNPGNKDIKIASKPDLLVMSDSSFDPCNGRSSQSKPMMFVKVKNPMGKNNKSFDGVKLANDNSDTESMTNDICKSVVPEEIEQLLNDLEMSKMKDRDVEVIKSFMSELLGEMLLLFAYGEERLFNLKKWYDDKPIRYGIGVIGFKVMFVAVCMFDQGSKLSSKPSVDKYFVWQKPSLRTDVFMTRQFHLLHNEDRHCVADILFALGARRLSQN